MLPKINFIYNLSKFTVLPTGPIGFGGVDGVDVVVLGVSFLLELNLDLTSDTL